MVNGVSVWFLISSTPETLRLPFVPTAAESLSCTSMVAPFGQSVSRASPIESATAGNRAAKTTRTIFISLDSVEQLLGPRDWRLPIQMPIVFPGVFELHQFSVSICQTHGDRARHFFAGCDDAWSAEALRLPCRAMVHRPM